MPHNNSRMTPTGRHQLVFAIEAAATIAGVGFGDRMHGQTGVARNGAELHPVVALTNVVCG